MEKVRSVSLDPKVTPMGRHFMEVAEQWVWREREFGLHGVLNPYMAVVLLFENPWVRIDGLCPDPCTTGGLEQLWISVSTDRAHSFTPQAHAAVEPCGQPGQSIAPAFWAEACARNL